MCSDPSSSGVKWMECRTDSFTERLLPLANLRIFERPVSRVGAGGVEEGFGFFSVCKEFAFASAAQETVRTGIGVGE